MQISEDNVQGFKEVLRVMGGFTKDNMDLVDIGVFIFEGAATVLFAYSMRRSTTWLRRKLTNVLIAS